MLSGGQLYGSLWTLWTGEFSSLGKNISVGYTPPDSQPWDHLHTSNIIYGLFSDCVCDTHKHTYPHTCQQSKRGHEFNLKQINEDSTWERLEEEREGGK